MGLFSTLGGSASASGPSVASSSSVIPTVVQLYADKPIQLDVANAKVNAYTAMTYQAVQVASSNEELKNKHQNPDLGVWNCAVKKTPVAIADEDKSPPLVDHVLNKIIGGSTAPGAFTKNTYILTVDLSGGEEALSKVEPTISLLQEALIRHFIEHPPASSPARDADAAATNDGAHGDDGDVESYQTATTTLFDLKATRFGLAPEDTKSLATQEQTASDRDVKFCLMICAIMPIEPDEPVAEVSYRTKQAKELVIYHLRRYAYALNTTLCFVAPDSGAVPAADGSAAAGEEATVRAQQQPTVPFSEVGQLWRDLALDKPIWGDAAGDEVSPLEDIEEAVANPTSALYGPGKHQEDLIESVLLRNAHCPGHWEANKDSLWVALPAAQAKGDDGPETPSGDQSWLTQLRDSIASAMDQAKLPATPNKKDGDEDAAATPDGKDPALSSFFQGLLNKP